MAEAPAQSPSFIYVHLLQNACQLEAAWLFPSHRGRDKLTEGRGRSSALLGPVSRPPVPPPLQGRLEPWGGRGCQAQLPRHHPASLPGGLGPWIPEGYAGWGREAQHLFPHSLGPAANRVLPARTPAQPCPPTRAPSASPASSGISSFRSILRAPRQVPGTPHALLPMCFCSRMPCLNLPASLPPQSSSLPGSAQTPPPSSLP